MSQNGQKPISLVTSLTKTKTPNFLHCRLEGLLSLLGVWTAF